MSLSHESTNELTEQIIGAAIEVHRYLGPGLLESNYEDGFCIEMEDRGIPYRRQPMLPVSYKGRKVRAYYRPDVIVAQQVIVEIKAVDRLAEIHKAQVLTYLRHADLHVGLLFNFNAPTLMAGMKRFSL